MKARAIKITVYATTTETVDELLDRLNNTKCVDKFFSKEFNIHVNDEIDVEVIK